MSKTKTLKQAEAEIREQERAKRTAQEQLALIAQRRGASKREKARLAK